MTWTSEAELRVWALELATAYSPMTLSAEEIVARAEKFLEFVQGKQEAVRL